MPSRVRGVEPVGCPRLSPSSGAPLTRLATFSREGRRKSQSVTRMEPRVAPSVRPRVNSAKCGIYPHRRRRPGLRCAPSGLRLLEATHERQIASVGRSPASQQNGLRKPEPISGPPRRASREDRSKPVIRDVVRSTSEPMPLYLLPMEIDRDRHAGGDFLSDGRQPANVTPGRLTREDDGAMTPNALRRPAG